MRRTVVSAVVALVAYVAGIALLHVEATGQPPSPNPIRYVTADPTGNTAAAASIALRTTTGRLYTSQSGVYALVPAGAFAGSLAGDVTGTQAATVVGAVGGKTISLANSLTTSGNFALTLTQTAATNVTLPPAGLLRAQIPIDRQGPLGVVSMTGSDVTLFTTTIPANTMGVGGCVGLTWQIQHTTGTGATAIKFFFGGSSQSVNASSVDVSIWTQPVVQVCNDAGVTNTQHFMASAFSLLTGSHSVWNNQNGSFAIDTTQPVIVKVTANDATGTDRWTPIWWMVQ